jgi:hypothetical protein
LHFSISMLMLPLSLVREVGMAIEYSIEC